MLDFEREDEWLRQTVGADSGQILGAASGGWADRFYLTRERMLELADDPAPDEAALIERDRLASYFGCAYGRAGLLARAGALLTLRDRLQRAAVLAPLLAEDAAGMGRLRREGRILGAFARGRLGRGRPGAEDRALVEAVARAAEGLSDAADFIDAACAIDSRRGGFKGLGLWAAADIGQVLAHAPERPFTALAAFLLARAGDHAALARTDGAAYAHLVEDGLARLRRALWETAAEGLGLASEPPGLAGIEQADRELEELLALFAQPRLPGNVGARLLAEVLARTGAARAAQASAEAGSALEATLQVLAEGLAADMRSHDR